MPTPNTGILITNIGTPDAPTPTAVRRYLKKFLSDPHVVKLPRFIWWPILYGFILPFRSHSSAKLYQKIWTEQGSPLLIFSQQIADALQKKLQLPVELGLHYSDPSIKTALEKLRAQQVKKIIVLPLYPQYSVTTTASTFNSVKEIISKWHHLPELHMINHYAYDENYINTLCDSIEKTWKEKGKAQYLLFSFHGIPQRYVDKGDPYVQQCHATAQAVAKKLQLENKQWSVAFQSRLGRAKWATPYTDQVLMTLPKQGITNLQVICPGFAADCLESLEEIAIRGKEQFLNADGKSFHYISALNHHPLHIETLAKILVQETLRK